MIRRSKFGVGKLIGGQLYIQKDYVDVLPEDGQDIFESYREFVPFDFNCIKYDVNTSELAFIESPDFDTAREPVVGRLFVVKPDGRTRKSPYRNQIYHHKWLFVDNSYNGFDVAESWEWSKTWLSVLTEPADGSNFANWKAQLARFNLQ